MFCLRHHPAGQLRFRVLLCPPILHEQIRSYRFLSLLGGRLAALGVEVIRFDYANTGDSPGPTAMATHSAMQKDIAQLLRHECARAPDVRTGILGVRWGAVLASQVLQTVPVDFAWWWQPVLSGDDYANELLALDETERTSSQRYPWNARFAPREPNELLGFGVPADFLPRMRELSLHDHAAVACVAQGTVVPFPCQKMILPTHVTGWVTETEYAGLVPTGPIETTLRELVAGIEAQRR